MITWLGWTNEDRKRRMERVRAQFTEKLGPLDTIDAIALRRLDLLKDILEWDVKRGYIMPYRLRDPIRLEIEGETLDPL